MKGGISFRPISLSIRRHRFVPAFAGADVVAGGEKMGGVNTKPKAFRVFTLS
jgi:hypothetical protein